MLIEDFIHHGYLLCFDVQGSIISFPFSSFNFQVDCLVSSPCYCLVDCPSAVSTSVVDFCFPLFVFRTLIMEYSMNIFNNACNTQYSP